MLNSFSTCRTLNISVTGVFFNLFFVVFCHFLFCPSFLLFFLSSFLIAFSTHDDIKGQEKKNIENALNNMETTTEMNSLHVFVLLDITSLSLLFLVP